MRGGKEKSKCAKTRVRTHAPGVKIIEELGGEWLSFAQNTLIRVHNKAIIVDAHSCKRRVGGRKYMFVLM